MWRDPHQVTSQWEEAAGTDPALLRHVADDGWWEALAATRSTVIVTREYEHLVMAMRATDMGPEVSFMRMPHPSGLAIDLERGRVFVASTRNPNQIFELAPATGLLERSDLQATPSDAVPLVPVRSWFYPGSLYLHDLGYIGGELHGNAVGHNAVVRLLPDGGFDRVWWPRCVEVRGRPRFDRNFLQLNSIAGGDDLASSFFSASADRISARRPGHRNFPVDRRGVIFSGATREPVARGLTRPHSARLHRGSVWVDDSGYGGLCVVRGDGVETVATLPGWTRGLVLRGGMAFVGTSRVIPRFRQYAPGLDVGASLCGVHAVDLGSGEVVGSLHWPSGNQIFAVDLLPSGLATGFPFSAGGRRATTRERDLFYAFETSTRKKGSI